MRKRLLSSLLIAISVSSTFAIQQKLSLQTSNSKQEFTVVNKTTTDLTLFNSISTISINDTEVKGHHFIELFSEGYYKNTEIGSPQLPRLSQLIEIPSGAEARIMIIDYDEEIINLSDYGISNLILPVQPSYSKSQDPDDVPFMMNEQIYNSNALYSRDVVHVEYIGVSRGVNIGRLNINPFSYNPITNQLVIKNNLIVKVSFVNADLELTKSKKQQFYSPAFNSVFSNLLSVEQVPTKDAIVDYGPVKYIIVSDRMFETALIPFVEWKTKKGFNVIQAYTDVIGTTNSAIKTYLQDQYNNPSDGISPSYVLLVGDMSQIPAWNSSNSGSGGTDHITDLYYCEYTNDYIPEVYYGRFSANSVAELTPQINKTIEYERFEMPDPTFLNDVVLVAGVDAGMAPSYGNGQINYGTNEYFNAAHGFTNIYAYLYGSGSPITSDNSGAAAAIHQNVSDGVGFVNYTAHCDWDGWADPSFSVDDIDNLTNDGKYSLMIGNCCRSNRFNTSSNGGTCFGEKIMRAQNAGVIGYIGGSDYSYWDEDFYWGVGVDQIGITAGTANSHTYENTGLGAYDGSFHENGEPESDWYVTSGQMLMVGNLAVTEGGSGYVHYYWEIYHLMGDPSLMAYFTVPTVINAIHSTSVPVGTNNFTVNTDAPGCYVAISKDGVLLDAQLADASGNITLNFSSISSTGTADIVATKQNRAPYIGTVTIIVGTEPPIADFSGNPTTIYENETVNFTDLSTEAPSSWLWDFGDGSTSTIQYPSHVYSNAGVYTVTLTATNNIDSDQAIKTDYITVNAITEAPAVDFVANQTIVAVSTVINFTDLSTLLPTAWLWDFGDGTTSTSQNPTHAYTSSGFFTVSLTATNIVGDGYTTKVDYIEVTLDPYCDASSTGTNYENITNVTFGTINNNSGSDGYADYTSIVTDVNMADTYTFSVSYDQNYSSDEVIVWIDWNQNHIFEDTEKYDVASGSGGNSPYTLDITIPTDAIAGSTRMRVRLHDTSAGPNSTPCGDSSWGEVEDYTVNVISNIIQSIDNDIEEIFSIYPNPSSDRLIIKSTIETYHYKINSIDGRIVSQGKNHSSSNKNIDVSNLNSGVYFIEIQSIKGKIIKKIIIE